MHLAQVCGHQEGWQEGSEPGEIPHPLGGEGNLQGHRRKAALGNMFTPSWERGEVSWLRTCELQAKADLQDRN